jgi:hypothetical protein
MSMFKPKALKKLFRFLYLKLVRIHDTPQKISIGLALGVFSGLMPGTGPLAAITLAIFLRVNRLAALIGSIITNTWLSILILIPAIKLGSMILNMEWSQVYKEWMVFLSTFSWPALFKLSIYKIILPVLVGYATLGLALAIFVYVLSLSLILLKKHGIKNRGNFS